MEECYEWEDETLTDLDYSDPEWRSEDETDNDWSTFGKSGKGNQKGGKRYGKGRSMNNRVGVDVAKEKLAVHRDSLIGLLNAQNPTSERCGRPKSSYATKTTLTVAWCPPAHAIGKELFQYELQYCVVPEPTSTAPVPESVTKDGWASIANPIEGLGHELGHLHTVSWVVEKLPKKKWVTFRVHVSNCEAYSDWSDPSQPFKVGCMCYSPVGTGVGGDTWTKEEKELFMTLDTPMKVQDFLDTFPMNQEVQDDVSLSALECVRQNHAHCLEGAILGAYILGMHGYGTLLMDLRASEADDDHCVTPFQWKGRWGCLSVSNHASLRYRNPVYMTLREMVMSYFDDYMNGRGMRTLRAYSVPMDLEKEYGRDWWNERGNDGSRDIAEKLDLLPHYRLFRASDFKRGLRAGDEFMLKTTVDQREWAYPANADEDAKLRNINR